MMEYRFEGHRKQLREAVDHVAETYGADCSYKAGEFRLVLARRRKAEQYAFVGTVTEKEGECFIEGNIERTGESWKWYDYFLSVLLCLLIIPGLLLLVSPALMGTGTAQVATDTAVLPLSAPSKRAMRTKLSRTMSLFAEEIEETNAD